MEKKPKGPPRDAEATKTRILDAAEEEFAQSGILGARTESIAAKTGVTKSMIFYHFSDKEGLYRAVLERGSLNRLRFLQTVDYRANDPVESLRSMAAAVMDDAMSSKNMSTIYVYEAIQNKGKFYSQVAIASLYEPLINILKQGMEKGIFRQVDAKHASVNIVAICVFYFIARENVKHLWSASADLMCEEMMLAHKHQALEQIIASVLAVN